MQLAENSSNSSNNYVRAHRLFEAMQDFGLQGFTSAILFLYVDATIGFRDAITVVRANESDGEVIILVASDGGNEEAVSVEYGYKSGTAQGN